MPPHETSKVLIDFLLAVPFLGRVRARREVSNMTDAGIELGDGVCDFENVLPDQLCPSAKRD